MEIRYIKYENGEIVYNNPSNDNNGSITGKCVLNLLAYFDENPEEWRRCGFTRIIDHYDEMLDKYDPQTQFLVMEIKSVDEQTIEQVYNVVDKSEEMLLFEELFIASGIGLSPYHYARAIHIEI